EILEHILGAAEGWLGVDHPVFAKQRSEPGGEEFGLHEPRQIPGKMQLASLKGQLESVDKLAAKHLPEHGKGEKEAGVRSNPAGVIEREPAGGNNAVDMRMNLELLVPGVEHTEKADLSSDVPSHSSPADLAEIINSVAAGL
ncbi:MAG: hypothetical protein WA477_20885, partial [Candidatus Sulfotelmatobacter sp.]